MFPLISVQYWLRIDHRASILNLNLHLNWINRCRKFSLSFIYEPFYELYRIMWTRARFSRGRAGRLPRCDSHGSCLPSTPHGRTIDTSLLIFSLASLLTLMANVLQEIPGSETCLFLSFWRIETASAYWFFTDEALSIPVLADADLIQLRSGAIVASIRCQTIYCILLLLWLKAWLGLMQFSFPCFLIAMDYPHLMPLNWLASHKCGSKANMRFKWRRTPAVAGNCDAPRSFE